MRAFASFEIKEWLFDYRPEILNEWDYPYQKCVSDFFDSTDKDDNSYRKVSILGYEGYPKFCKHIPAIGFHWQINMPDFTVCAHLYTRSYLDGNLPTYRISISDGDDGCLSRNYEILEDAVLDWNSLDMLSFKDLWDKGFRP